MKKSEAIARLQKYININAGSLQVPEQILNFVEGLGMLPPKNMNKYNPVPSVTPTGNLDYSFINEWEPETKTDVSELVKADLGENAGRDFKKNLFED